MCNILYSRVWGRGGEEVSEVIYHCSTGNDSSDTGAATASATPSDQPRGSPLTKQLPSTASTPSDQPQEIPVTIAEPREQPEAPSTTVEVANITTKILKQNIEEEIQELDDQFFDVVYKAQCDLEKVDLAMIKLRITQLQVSPTQEDIKLLQEIRPEIEKAKTVSEIFSILSEHTYWDCLNCGLLNKIVRRFGSYETKQLMEKYAERLREFRAKTKLEDFIGKWARSSPSHFSEFVSEMGGVWRDRTLEDLENFRIELARTMYVEEHVLHYTRITPGSISVTWAIPSSLPGIADTLQAIFPRLKKEYDVLMVVFQGRHIPELSELAPLEVCKLLLP